MNITLILIGIIVGLFGYAWFQRNKRQVAEALNTNIDEKKQLNSLDQQKLVDGGEAERAQINADTKQKIEEKVNAEDIADFLNNRHTD